MLGFLVIHEILLLFIHCIFIFQVKVKNWADGVERDTFVGVNARFGSLLPIRYNSTLKWPVVLTNPLNGCSKSTTQVIHYLLLIAVVFYAF